MSFFSLITKILQWAICLGGILLGSGNEGLAQIDVAATPAQIPVPNSPLDQIWLVSTRHLETCCISDQFQVSVYDGCSFSSTTLEHLVSEFRSDQPLQTVIYVHGYRTNAAYAQYRGLQVYANSLAGVCHREGLRYIIWSWESEQETCLPRDFKIKSDRSVVEGHRLARFIQLARIQQGVLIGYSMGSQVALTNLVDLNQFHTPPAAWHLILVAPVLAPQSCCDAGRVDFDQIIESATVLTNATDRALKNARRLNRFSHRDVVDQHTLPNALSLTGNKLAVWETSGEVGTRHNIGSYSQTVAFRRTLAELLKIEAAAAQTVE
jgi:hypothetical protein